MEVILLEQVSNLGTLGDKVTVKAGYGRNFLVPQGKAVPATEINVARFDEQRAELEKAAKEKLAIAQQRVEQLSDLSLTIECRAGGEGKLFGSIGSMDIIEALASADIVVSKQEVRLPDGPLRQLGDYEIDLHLHTEAKTTLTVHLIEETEDEE